MHYLSFEKYAFEGMVVNEFEGRNIPCDLYNYPIGNGTTTVPVYHCLFPDTNNDGMLSGDEVSE